jgi:AsmA-like C-terminal region
MAAAGGEIGVSGYFNGSDPKKIYFSPVITMNRVDLDKLLFKFENFGQDHLVSENLHGKLNGSMTGKIRMHADMVPIVDDSEIHIDFEVIQGRLENYTALLAVADYFQDKNLNHVRFDTLSNTIDMKNGTLSIPAMTVNSSLGFIQLSGKQDLDMNMEYYVRVPWKLVTKAASQKLFGSGDKSTGNDSIQYMDETKRQRFLNLKITGTPDAYKISLGKDKTRK